MTNAGKRRDRIREQARSSCSFAWLRQNHLNKGKKWKHALHVVTKRRHASSWLPREKHLTVCKGEGEEGRTGFWDDDDDDEEDVYRLKICQKRHIVISSQCFPSVCSIKCIITPEFINMNEREQYHLWDQSEDGIMYRSWQLIHHRDTARPVKRGGASLRMNES